MRITDAVLLKLGAERDAKHMFVLLGYEIAKKDNIWRFRSINTNSRWVEVETVAQMIVAAGVEGIELGEAAKARDIRERLGLFSPFVD